MVNLRDLVRDVPDFPKPGILFRDITPILADAEAFEAATNAMSGIARVHGATKVLGIESRGFILGAPVAHHLSLPFVPCRKPGKLPAATARVEYDLEYGSDALEVHTDAVQAGDRVVIIDDLLATGGTAEAAARLCEQQGAEVASVLVMIELLDLGGAARLAPRHVYSLLKY
ncbi:MAG: adenine phosphoribosyltransferase [Myxococcales bacterium]|nr:adenine phosphoribosyltransferase [Myxococcales bacterium]